jgi:hypothetical protein
MTPSEVSEFRRIEFSWGECGALSTLSTSRDVRFMPAAVDRPEVS